MRLKIKTAKSWKMFIALLLAASMALSGVPAYAEESVPTSGSGSTAEVSAASPGTASVPAAVTGSGAASSAPATIDSGSATSTPAANDSGNVSTSATTDSGTSSTSAANDSGTTSTPAAADSGTTSTPTTADSGTASEPIITPAAPAEKFVYDSAAKAWKYYKKDVFQSKTTAIVKGTVSGTSASWYVKKGRVQFVTSIVKCSGGWWYVKRGRVQFIDSVEKGKNGWWRIHNGKINFKFRGIARNKHGWWYIKGGRVQFGFTGKIRYKGVSYNVTKGKVKVLTKKWFLKKCKSLMDYWRTHGTKYKWRPSPARGNYTNCAWLIDKALIDFGFTDIPKGGHAARELDKYLSKHPEFSRSTSFSDIKAGSIVLCFRKGSSKADHVFVAASSFDLATWSCDRYDAGSNGTFKRVKIKKVQPLKNYKWNDGNGYSRTKVVVFNLR